MRPYQTPQQKLKTIDAKLQELRDTDTVITHFKQRTLETWLGDASNRHIVNTIVGAYAFLSKPSYEDSLEFAQSITQIYGHKQLSLKLAISELERQRACLVKARPPKAALKQLTTHGICNGDKQRRRVVLEKSPSNAKPPLTPTPTP